MLKKERIGFIAVALALIIAVSVPIIGILNAAASNNHANHNKDNVIIDDPDDYKKGKDINPTPKPVVIKRACYNCVDGNCIYCDGTGTEYCNAYGCLGGGCMICFDGYETVMVGTKIKEVRCRTCGGDEKCNSCRGSGFVRCGYCSGGECRSCGGDGYI